MWTSKKPRQRILHVWRGVTTSNLGRDTDCPDWGSHGLVSCFKLMPGQHLKLGQYRVLSRDFNFIPRYSPTIRCCAVRVTARDVKLLISKYIIQMCGRLDWVVGIVTVLRAGPFPIASRPASFPAELLRWVPEAFQRGKAGVGGVKY